jgi:YidC/Oxa1 family membrane protein insertase
MYVALILQPIVDACHEILKFWHGVIGGSWGWAIIMLTVTVRLVILPLTFKGVKGMQRMQQLQPEIKKIQERYKGDKQRMNQEVMAFYQREKANPLSACFPLLLQIPFFISLFYLLRSSEFKADIAGHASFGPIDNLAEKITGDPVLLGALIVLYIGTQLAASMVTMVSGDPNQKRIMYAMPFVFSIFILNFQAGLIVYWITTNVWTIGQQLVVRKLYPRPEPISSDDDKPKAARGKPVPAATAAAVAGNDSGSATKESPKREPRAKRKAKAAASADGGGGGGNGRTAGSKPPPSPRKKKKRSGRRR